MAITKIADVIVPELFNRYVINRTMELSAFFQSGIVVNSPGFDALASEAARTHNMPFFEDFILMFQSARSGIWQQTVK